MIMSSFLVMDERFYFFLNLLISIRIRILENNGYTTLAAGVKLRNSSSNNNLKKTISSILTMDVYLGMPCGAFYVLTFRYAQSNILIAQ